MKNKILIVITSLVIVLTCSFGLAACGEFGRPSDTHTHSWSQSWQSNDTHHWHNCTADGCTIADNSQKDGYAEHDFTDGDCVCGKEKVTKIITFVLNVDKESYSVSGVKTATETDIVIPAEYNGKPVTSIGNSAFRGCSSLTSITIPESVTSIGYYAFYGCSSLTSITIPDSVTSIGDSAFSDCPIETATIPAIACKSIARSSLKTVVITSGESIDSAAFIGCSNLTNITIPFVGASKDGTSNTNFGYIFGGSNSYNALYVPASLRTVVITSGEHIDNSAFINCSSLTSITLPDSVTSIGDSAFQNCSSLTSITLPDGVTSIGSNAFNGCSSLTSISVADGNTKYHSAGNCLIETNSKTLIAGFKTSVIPTDDSVTSIGNSAFRGCSSLTSITIPDSISSIGSYTFYGCDSLESITIPFIGNENNEKHFGYIFGAKSYSYNSSYVPTSLKTVIITGGESIDSGAFWGCSSVTSVTVPNSVTEIGIDAFRACNSLERINYTGDIASWCGIDGLDNLIMKYGKSTKMLYIDGKEITGELVIPNSVTAIPSYAFYNCSSLTSITIPDSVTSIGDNAFNNCPIETATIPAIACRYINNSALKTVTITSGERIDYNAFNRCNGLTSITIPDGITSIGDWAFFYCSGLTSISIPDSVTNISSYAFSNCSSLTSITIGNGITRIGNMAFDKCPIETATIPTIAIDYISKETLKTVVITSGESIDSGAFYGCSSLTNVKIGDSVTSIGGIYNVVSHGAFENCSSLTSISIPNSITYIGQSAFKGCSNLQYNEYNNAYYLGNSNNPYLVLTGVEDTSITSCTIHENTKFICYSAFYNCSSLTSITIPNSVISIGNSAFRDCSNLTSITIPDSVTSIGDGAFENCSHLTSISIPDSVTSIENCTFMGCSSLTSITIPDSVTSIGSDVFRYCSNLMSISIPDSVTSIEICTFYGCSSLTSITIPNSVTSIGDNAFFNCSSLTSITFNGTKKQWNEIKKDYNWNYNTGNYTVHCTDGDMFKS